MVHRTVHVSPLQAHQRLPRQQIEVELVLVINNNQQMLLKGVL